MVHGGYVNCDSALESIILHVIMINDTYTVSFGYLKIFYGYGVRTSGNEENPYFSTNYLRTMQTRTSVYIRVCVYCVFVFIGTTRETL